MVVLSRIGRSEMFLGISLAAWILWVVISSLRSQYALEFSAAYLINPVVIVAGIIVGWALRKDWQRNGLVILPTVVLLVTAISIPIYKNASAAVGGLLLALVGLAALEYADGMKSQRFKVLEPRVLGTTSILVLIAAVAIWLLLDAQAAIALSIPVVMIIGLALFTRVGPPQWMSAVLGFGVAAIAGAIVVWLGSRTSWPPWLAASESLSSARHTLWSDALTLWASAPLFGAGPGSFTPSSELASSIPSLAATHSLFLQVGSELGIVGVVLLIAVFGGGLLFAARGNRRVALVAIAAWTALAIHSTIDHLEDFFIVAFVAGIVLGWSGLGRAVSDDPQGSMEPAASK